MKLWDEVELKSKFLSLLTAAKSGPRKTRLRYEARPTSTSLRPTSHPPSEENWFLQPIIRHHQPVCAAEKAQLPRFDRSVFLLSQVCDVPTSHKSVPLERKTAGMNDKSLLVVMLAELQPRGCAEPVGCSQKNSRPGNKTFGHAFDRYSFLPTTSRFESAKKKIENIENVGEKCSPPRSRRADLAITREGQMDGQMDGPENTTLAATAPTSSEPRR